AAHPTCPVLHPTTRRKLLDGEPLSADSPAHRAARVAPDVIGRTAQAGSRIGAGGGVSEVCSHGQQAFAARDVSGAGASRTARGTYREWAEWLGGTSRGPLTSPEEKRTWSISQMPVDVFAGVEAHVCRHAGQEDVLARLERLHGHGLSLQVADRAHLIASEQLETSEVDAGQHDNRVTCVDADDERAGERHREVGPRPPPVGVQRADLEERDA